MYTLVCVVLLYSRICWPAVVLLLCRPIFEIIREVKSGTEEDIPVMLVGNKCDENDTREVSHTEGEEQVRPNIQIFAARLTRSVQVLDTVPFRIDICFVPSAWTEKAHNWGGNVGRTNRAFYISGHIHKVPVIIGRYIIPTGFFIRTVNFKGAIEELQMNLNTWKLCQCYIKIKPILCGWCYFVLAYFDKCIKPADTSWSYYAK